jgi:transcriptional regulator of acetoin/glycerol metabolism
MLAKETMVMNPVSIDRSSGSSRSALLASDHAGRLKGRDIIRQSHERSRSFGLSDTMRPDYGVLSEADIRLKREQNRALSTHALPVIETLYGQIANTHSMVASGRAMERAAAGHQRDRHDHCRRRCHHGARRSALPAREPLSCMLQRADS